MTGKSSTPRSAKWQVDPFDEEDQRDQGVTERGSLPGGWEYTIWVRTLRIRQSDLPDNAFEYALDGPPSRPGGTTRHYAKSGYVSYYAAVRGMRTRYILSTSRTPFRAAVALCRLWLEWLVAATGRRLAFVREHPFGALFLLLFIALAIWIFFAIYIPLGLRSYR